MLTDKQNLIIERRIEDAKKKTWLAYVLLVLLGGLGSHRFYVNGPSAGAVGMLLLAVLTVGLAIIEADKASDMTLIALCVWQLVDLFLIPSMIRQRSAKMRKDLEFDAMMRA
ncbi:NINE protein [Brucella pseudogrignonensis]|uniref:TM2 domain-containing membrane protein YozV n=1 Tax=Brucella pseudogrignonensis TaxID=419475 RepID=A0ABU1MF08_9HYPH|nr:NINE protein [Brucella pseudogrignonensis]MDR6434629.1 TM2 domain-containing membrane protein YozV [Brucella pseudogrignonensis]